ncbi:MAG: hypothetical protein AAFW84_33400 [Cyanobacteria bacterium J06635_15]
MSDQRLEEIFRQFYIADQARPSPDVETSFHCSDLDIHLLFNALSNSELHTRAKAYTCLQNVSSSNPDTQKSIADILVQGIPLRPGDRIYGIYKAAISYDDEFFNLENQFSAELNEYLENNWESEGFETQEDFYENMAEEYGQFFPKRISQHVFRDTAIDIATSLHNQYAFEQDPILEFRSNSEFDFLEWCRDNHIETPNFSNIDPLDREFHKYEFKSQILLGLREKGDVKRFGDLCFNMIGSFTVVREEIVKEYTYLRSTIELDVGA